MPDDLTDGVADGQPVAVTLTADVSDQWSWAASAAGIPQISRVTLNTSGDLENAKITIAVHDGNEVYGTAELDGRVPAGTTELENLHVALSPTMMSRLDERRSADCSITLEDLSAGQLLAHRNQAIDLQPHDLWNRFGDPRRWESPAEWCRSGS